MNTRHELHEFSQMKPEHFSKHALRRRSPLRGNWWHVCLILHFAFLIFNLPAAPTNNPTAGTYSVTIDTNSVLVGTSTNLFKANSNLLVQATGTNINIVAGTGLNASTNGNNVTVGLTTPVTLANGGTGMSTAAAAASNVGTLYLGNGSDLWGTVSNTTPSYIGQIATMNWFGAAQPVEMFVASSTSTGGFTNQLAAPTGFYRIGDFSHEPSTSGNFQIIVGGNPQLQTNLSLDATLNVINASSVCSGSAVTFAWVGTNASNGNQSGAFPPWVDAAGNNNYMHDFQAMAIGFTPDAAPSSLVPSSGWIVTDGRRPFELFCAVAPNGFANGNYSFFQSDPAVSTGNYLLHIPHLVSGAYSFTNSAWLDTAVFDVSAGNFVFGGGASGGSLNTATFGGTNFLFISNTKQGLKIYDGTGYNLLQAFSSDNGTIGFYDESGHQYGSFGNFGLNAASGGLSTRIIAQSGNYTLGDQDSTIIVTASGKTMTLPTAANPFVGSGRQYTVKLTVSGSCTIATTSSQTIDGAATYSISAQNKYVTVQSDGANWWVIANN